jgi:hypothetical protein
MVLAICVRDRRLVGHRVPVDEEPIQNPVVMIALAEPMMPFVAHVANAYFISTVAQITSPTALSKALLC